MRFIFLVIITLLIACTKEDTTINAPDSKTILFGMPKKVNINGYDAIIMEPFLSRDGNTLFFNNSNSASVNTNLHFATRIDDVTFNYLGELKGVNTESLEGTPTMDSLNNLYFVSTRSYDETLSTIYCGKYNTDSISEVNLLSNISRNEGGWVNFDVEVSKDGNYLFFVDGRFDSKGGPYEANLVLARKENGIWQRAEDQSLLKNLNTNDLEYAACISSDMLEIYFTRIELPLTNFSIPQIYVATRDSLNETFHKPYKISEIIGFTEGPTLSPDNKIIYYHKKENENYVLYMVEKE